IRQRASRLSVAHLLGRGIQVTDQFGSMQLRLRRLRHLLIDSGAETTMLPSAPSAPDNFTCYGVRPPPRQAPTARILTEVARYGTASMKLGRPYELCVPAQVDGGPRSTSCRPDSLLCYRSRSLSGFSRLGQVLTNNQFGAGTQYVGAHGEVCVPAVTY